MFYQVFNVNNYLIALLALVAIIGDFLVSHSQIHLFQAVFDNVTHAVIGGISWLIVCFNLKNHFHVEALIQIGLCATIASLIDLDHFIAAKSIHLKDATNLQKRPPLHCSTFPVGFCLTLLFLSYLTQAKFLKTSALIVLTAFVSHHTRDATRRGYWFYPFGSTSPIPYFTYVGLTCIIPYLICSLHRFVKISASQVSYESVI